MSEEINKKAEELKEGAELSEEELDGVAGGAFGFGSLAALEWERERLRKKAEWAAQLQCEYCGKTGAWIKDDIVRCKWCNAVL